MSFVNDVLAEEADRKGLVLFEDYSTFQNVDFSPSEEGAVLKKKYWLNFLLAVFFLMMAIFFVNQLPVSQTKSQRYSVVEESYSEVLNPSVMTLTISQEAPLVKKDPDYYHFIASLQQQTGKHEKAIAIYQQILQSQPENGTWWLGLGISLMAEARNKEALFAFKSSLSDQRVSSALQQFANQRIIYLKDRGYF